MQISELSSLLSRLSDYPLTNEQINAVADDSHRQLLIAAAGSGKSSTLIAKVYYLLYTGLALPHEICILAYNEDAQKSLAGRFEHISQRLNMFEAEDPAAKNLAFVINKTFHAFGLEVIAQVKGQKPNLHPLASMNRSDTVQFFLEHIQALIQQDEEFRKQWHNYLALAKKPRPNLNKISKQKEYNDYLIQMGAVYHLSKNNKRVPTFTALNGIKVRSLEALSIANWLWMHGIEFSYLAKMSGSANKHAYADFYYPEADLYHFHTALDENRKWPAFLKDYGEQLKKRRQMARSLEVEKFETHSADFTSGEVYKKLETTLKEAGVSFKPRDEDKIAQAILAQFQPEQDLSIFESFLRHFKANDADSSIFCENTKELDYDPIRTELFGKIFTAVYQVYQMILQDAQQIDFNDQINHASELLEQGAFQHSFKYLLIDEFQDISQDRKRLIQAILQQNSACKLFAVGDDWQSIYRFSGSDIEIMAHFPKHFGTTQTNYLTETFRSYQSIVDVASDFIQANPLQLKKEVKAQANIPQNTVQVFAYENGSEQEKQIWKILGKLNAAGQKRNLKLSVFLLARYHRLKPQNLAYYQQQFPYLLLEFKTIHASKGLEADYVLLLSVESGAYGFPSTLNDDPLLHKVIPEPELYPHAEERRLLYVALTRAKRGVFVYSSAQDTSPFIYELAKHKLVDADEHFSEADLCPKCQSGKLVERRGQWGIFFGCSHYPACDFTESKTCPECEQGTMQAKEGENGRFFGCSQFPKCRHTES